MQRSRLIDPQRLGIGAGVIETDLLNKSTVAWGSRICHHHTEARLLLTANAAQSDFDHTPPRLLSLDRIISNNGKSVDSVNPESLSGNSQIPALALGLTIQPEQT
jgi:hypothetical protein